MPAIEPSQLAYLATKNTRVPAEGPKAIPVQLKFATLATADLDLDLTNAQQLTKISLVQCMYVDNGRNGSPLTITVLNSQMNVTVQPNTQAFIPIFCPSPVRMHFTSNGAIDDCFVFLLNFPVSPFLWKTV